MRIRERLDEIEVNDDEIENEEKIQRRYEWKIYPNKDQEKRLIEGSRLLDNLYNGLLERFETITRRTMQRQTFYECVDAELIEAKKQYEQEDHEYTLQLDEWISNGAVTERPAPSSSLLSKRQRYFMLRTSKTENGKKYRAIRHVGKSVHSLTWESTRKKKGEKAVFEHTKYFSQFDMQNEVTYAFNQIPELRELSIWCGHRTAVVLSQALDAFVKGIRNYPKYRKIGRRHRMPLKFLSGTTLQLDEGAKSKWMLSIKGIDGKILTRGKLPALRTDLRPSRQRERVCAKFIDADIIHYGNNWWVSVAMAMEKNNRTSNKLHDVLIEFIPKTGMFARVNGYEEEMPELWLLQDKQAELDELKSFRDTVFPRRVKRDAEADAEFQKLQRQITSLSTYIKHCRSNILHKWSSRIVQNASFVKYTKPKTLKRKSGKGNEISWGGNTRVVAEINQSLASLAPGAAIEMLRYKCHEAGIGCSEVDGSERIDTRDLVRLKKGQRRMNRDIKNEVDSAVIQRGREHLEEIVDRIIERI